MSNPNSNGNRKESNMQKQRATRNEEPREPSALHRMLGLTPAEVDRELGEFGEAPRQAVEAFDAALAKAKRALAKDAMASIEEQARKALSSSEIRASSIRLPIFEESVAAGPATPSSLGEARPTAMSDFFRGASSTEGNFFVRVSGVSMIQAGIFDGDLAMVDPKAEPKPGDIVLAYIAPHGQVVKKLACDKDGLALLSANPDYEPIRIANPEDLTIHGKVVWVCGARGR